jgi:hypothetical protein
MDQVDELRQLRQYKAQTEAGSRRALVRALSVAFDKILICMQSPTAFSSQM